MNTNHTQSGSRTEAVAAAIKERRSIKQFKAEPLPAGLLEELLDIAVWAPNHGLREPWRFIAFTGEGTGFLADAAEKWIQKSSGNAEFAAKKRGYIAAIPASVIVVMPEDPRQREWDEDFAAVSALIQNLQLAAWERGVGTIWKTDPYIYAPAFRDAMGVKPGEKIAALIHLGYAEKVPGSHPRTPSKDVTLVVDRYPEGDKLD